MSGDSTEQTPLLQEPEAAKQPTPSYVEAAENQTKSPYQEVNQAIHGSLQEEVITDSERPGLTDSGESNRSLADSRLHEVHTTS